MTYVPNDDNRKFTELYTVQRLKNQYIAKDAQVCISTIQRMYSILKDEPLDEALAIMQEMAQSGHIDPELFALFLRTGVYLDYAQLYLPPEQQDDVDVSQMVAAL